MKIHQVGSAIQFLGKRVMTFAPARLDREGHTHRHIPTLQNFFTKSCTATCTDFKS